MSKEIKSIGLAIAALPISFALLELLVRFDFIQQNSPSAWSTLKFVVVIVCGCAYFIGLKIFADTESGNTQDAKETDDQK
jgi:hypothetical protein